MAAGGSRGELSAGKGSSVRAWSHPSPLRQLRCRQPRRGTALRGRWRNGARYASARSAI